MNDLNQILVYLDKLNQTSFDQIWPNLNEFEPNWIKLDKFEPNFAT